jgi:hypothetical protein
LEYGKLKELFTYDQMSLEIKKGKMDINGFTEDRINFRPTYKHDPGHNTYSYDTDGKNPGWTDRILFKRRDEEYSQIKAIKYDSIMDICLSDHKPVYAVFEIKIYEKLSEKKRNTIDIPRRGNFKSNVSNSKACNIF